MLILQYLIAILGFSVIVLVHEFGHFIIAKLSGIHVQEFFLGFGPKILKYTSKKSGTMYGISAIPLGGYNKILGQDRNESIPVDLKGKAFFDKPFYKKFLVISGGGIFNIIFSIILIMIYFSLGVFVPSNIIDYTQPGSPAETYGFQKGDKVISLNEREIKSWDDFSVIVKDYPDKVVTFKILRNGKEMNIDTKLSNVDGNGYLGVGPLMVKEKMGGGQVITESFKMFGELTVTYIKLFGMLFSGQIPFSEARPVSPIGVISIFQQSAQMGAQNFILFVALVSILLAFGNFLPILPVDGGHLVIIIIEAIRRRPVPKKVIEVYNTLGIVLVVSLLLVGVVFDIISPFKLPSM